MLSVCQYTLQFSGSYLKMTDLSQNDKNNNSAQDLFAYRIARLTALVYHINKNFDVKI